MEIKTHELKTADPGIRRRLLAERSDRTDPGGAHPASPVGGRRESRQRQDRRVLPSRQFPPPVSACPAAARAAARAGPGTAAADRRATIRGSSATDPTDPGTSSGRKCRPEPKPVPPGRSRIESKPFCSFGEPQQPVPKPPRRSPGDASRLKHSASLRPALRFGRNTPGIPPSRALSAGRLARLDAHAGFHHRLLASLLLLALGIVVACCPGRRRSPVGSQSSLLPTIPDSLPLPASRSATTNWTASPPAAR